MRLHPKQATGLVVVAIMLASCAGSSPGGTPSPGGSASPQSSASGPASTPTTPTSTITIGHVVSLTGPASSVFGIPLNNAVQLAIDDVNASGYLGNIRLEAKGIDDASVVANSVTAFNTLADEEIPLVLGSNLTPNMLAIAPIANDRKVIFLSIPSQGIPGENVDGYLFHSQDATGPSVNQGRWLADNAKRVAAIVANDNPNLVAIGDGIARGMKERGSAGYVSLQSVKGTDTDFSSVLTNIREANPDAVVIVTVPEQGGNILRQMQTAGFENVRKAGYISWTKVVTDVAGNAAVGAVFPTIWLSTAERSQPFVTAYEAKYGVEPSSYSALAYQTIWWVATAIKLADSADPTAAELKAQLAPAAESADFASRKLIDDWKLVPPVGVSIAGIMVTFNESGEVVVVP